MRNCPICDSGKGEVLYTFTPTYASQQIIRACPCGMIYASTSGPSYTSSIYSRPAAYGAGETPSDCARLEEVAAIIARNSDVTASILDVGCARGGMLDALKRAGFHNTCGIDPSSACVLATQAKGHDAYVGTLDYKTERKHDTLIFSHVLEHIDDPQVFLTSALDHLKINGQIYVEVPDAENHINYSLPFLEFNSEHINHFGEDSLRRLLEKSGFQVEQIWHSCLKLANNVQYPVLRVIATRRYSTLRFASYIDRSRSQMIHLNAHLARELEGHAGCVIWGAGEYFAHIVTLPIFETCPIMQVVDSNMHGRNAIGYIVQSPPSIRPDLPIVIAALTAAPISIKADIANMGLTNKVISLEVK